MGKKRNTVVDIAKLAFAVAIVLFHGNLLVQGTYNWETDLIIMPSGYMAVEFFFIVSGYLMAAKSIAMRNVFEGGVGSETLFFIKRKFSVMFPYFFFSWVIGFIVQHMPPKTHWNDILGDAVFSVFVLLQINISGLDGYTVSGVLWYLSAMYMAILMIYPFLSTHRNLFTRVIAPLLAIFIYGYISKTRGNLSAGTVWRGFIYIGMLRSIAGISLGCVCYEVASKLKELSLTKASKVLLTFFELAGYIFSLVMMSFLKLTRCDFVMVLLFAVSVTISFSGQSFSGSFFKREHHWMALLSESLYLAHGIVVGVVKEIFASFDRWQRLPWYLFFSLLGGIIVMLGGNVIKEVWVKQKHRLKALFLTSTEL